MLSLISINHCLVVTSKYKTICGLSLLFGVKVPTVTGKSNDKFVRASFNITLRTDKSSQQQNKTLFNPVLLKHLSSIELTKTVL